MDVQFFGGMFHQQILQVPGEQRELPQSLRNPLGDPREVYIRHTIQIRGHEEPVYVLEGYKLRPQDFTAAPRPHAA